jgi:hypothetical protein
VGSDTAEASSKVEVDWPCPSGKEATGTDEPESCSRRGGREGEGG